MLTLMQGLSNQLSNQHAKFHEAEYLGTLTHQTDCTERVHVHTFLIMFQNGVEWLLLSGVNLVL